MVKLKLFEINNGPINYCNVTTSGYYKIMFLEMYNCTVLNTQFGI